MQVVRPAIALDSRMFGKRHFVHRGDAASATDSRLADLKLFAATFLVGFAFVSIFLA
jgi:hypothetical protein